MVFLFLLVKGPRGGRACQQKRADDYFNQDIMSFPKILQATRGTNMTEPIIEAGLKRSHYHAQDDRLMVPILPWWRQSWNLYHLGMQWKWLTILHIYIYLYVCCLTNILEVAIKL